MTSDQFIQAPVAEWLDPAWHFEMLVPAAGVALPGPPRKPESGSLLPIVRYAVRAPMADLAVSATVLDREVNLDDWLAELPWVCEVSVDKQKRSRGGTIGDLAVSWGQGAERQVGRLFARREGSRVFVVFGASDPESFARLESFEPCVNSFKPRHKAEDPFAEPLQRFDGELPFPWHVRLPASWTLLPGATSAHAAGFQADHVRRTGERRGSMVGKLAFAVATRASAQTPAEVAQWYLAELRCGGLDVGELSIESITPPKNYRGAWTGIATVNVDALAGEVRFRVLCHASAWILAGVLTVLRDDDPEAWLQNTRVLDLLVQTVRITS